MIYSLAKKGLLFDGAYLIGLIRNASEGRTALLLAYGHTIDILDSETEDPDALIEALKADMQQAVQQRAQQGVTQAVATQTYLKVMGKAECLMSDEEGAKL